MSTLRVVPLEETVNQQQTNEAVREILTESIARAAVEKRPFFTEENKKFLFSILFFPITVIAWILSLPIQAFTWIVITVRTRRYDPEKEVCPACGFRGDSGSNGKTCFVRFIETAGPERAAVQHVCFRCGCDKFTTRLFRKADDWMSKKPIERVE